MNIDLKKPINSSLFSILIAFLLSIMVLFISKTSYITEIDRKKRKKNIYRLFIYSILFALLVGICVLFIPIKTTNTPPLPPILEKSYIPN